jgi:anaerobic selenocysteine-containing dehydrogenase
LAKEYPLIITIGGRASMFRHSELRNMPLLWEIGCPNWKFSINPKTAERLGIRNGDRVLVESPRGGIEAKAHLTEGIDPRVVRVPSHWLGKSNVNIPLHNEDCAPMIGEPS